MHLSMFWSILFTNWFQFMYFIWHSMLIMILLYFVFFALYFSTLYRNFLMSILLFSHLVLWWWFPNLNTLWLFVISFFSLYFWLLIFIHCYLFSILWSLFLFNLFNQFFLFLNDLIEWVLVMRTFSTFI